MKVDPQALRDQATELRSWLDDNDPDEWVEQVKSSAAALLAAADALDAAREVERVAALRLERLTDEVHAHEKTKADVARLREALTEIDALPPGYIVEARRIARAALGEGTDLMDRAADAERERDEALAEVARLLVESETRLAVLRGCSGENQRLRDALTFYANEENYRFKGAPGVAVEHDRGSRARAALGEGTDG